MKILLAAALLMAAGTTGICAADLTQAFEAMTKLKGAAAQDFKGAMTVKGMTVSSPRVMMINDEVGSAGVEKALSKVLGVTRTITDAAQIVAAHNSMNYVAIYASTAPVAEGKHSMLVVCEDNYRGTTTVTLSYETPGYIQCVAAANIYVDWTGTIIKPVPEDMYEQITGKELK